MSKYKEWGINEINTPGKIYLSAKSNMRRNPVSLIMFNRIGGLSLENYNTIVKFSRMKMTNLSGYKYTNPILKFDVTKEPLFVKSNDYSLIMELDNNMIYTDVFMVALK